MPDKLIELAERNWHKPSGLIFCIGAAILFEIVLLNSLDTKIFVSIIIYVISLFIVSAAWFYSNRYPKTANGKVGFVVSIECSSEEENLRIKEDFTDTLRRLLKNGTLGGTFHFIEIPQHLAAKIKDNDDATNLKVKTKAHFVIYGRVRLRPIDGKDCHVLELEGLVAHKQLPQEISNQLANEFRELFPRRVRIPTENDLLSFNFTSEWTECVAVYIIGIASALSIDLVYAEQLFRDVEKKLKGTTTDFPIFEKLRQRLPIRFAEINKFRALVSLRVWRKQHSQEALSQFSENINKIPEGVNDDYDTLLLRGIEAFLLHRDMKTALSCVNKCKKYDDPIWHFNLAFLNAYNEELVKAIRQYRICANYEIQPITLTEVEDFLVWILQEEPNKYQFHYCLGFFNWKIKGDILQARDDFNKFLKCCNKGEFEKEKELTIKWIEKIENQIAEQEY
jgi:hypothetical protein